MIVKCYIRLTLSLGIAHGQLLLSPDIAESCSTINISAVYFNMSDPSQSCPSNWTPVNSPISGCGRDIEYGTVRSVRIKKRKKEDWEGDRRKNN